MKNNTEKNQSYVVISIIIAVLIVTVISVAIVAGISNSKSGKTTPLSSSQTPVSTGGVDNTDKSVEDIPDQSGKTTQSTGDQTTASEPKETKSSKAQVEASVAPDEYTVPVNGYLLKGHDSELMVFSLTMNDYRVHMGVDIGASPGDQVSCVADGVVKEIYTDPFMGMCMSVDHGGGVISVYKNLSTELPQEIEVGVPVTMGQTIAGVGQSADLEMSDSDHLHFEMTVNGEQVDPLGFIDPSGTRLGEINYEE